MSNVSKFKTDVTKLLLLQMSSSSECFWKNVSEDHLSTSQDHVPVLSLSRLTDFSGFSQFLYWPIPSHFRTGSD